jgi:hypothetical protein
MRLSELCATFQLPRRPMRRRGHVLVRTSLVIGGTRSVGKLAFNGLDRTYAVVIGVEYDGDDGGQDDAGV